MPGPLPTRPLVKLAAAPALALLAASLWPHAARADLPGAAYPSAAVTPSPSACTIPQGSGTCATTLSWTSSHATPAHQLWVQSNGAPPAYMACGSANGSATATWIQAGVDYRFTLHPSASCQASDRGVEAASARVRGDAARIAASPNPCSIGPGGTCATTLTWQSGYGAPAHQLWVQSNGGAPAYMACGGAGGSTSAPWIQDGIAYTFTLYTAASCNAADRGAPVASQEVHGYARSVVADGTELWLGGAPFRTGGMNKFDLFYQFLGIASGGAGTAVTRPMALQALADAQAHGVKFMRIAGSGFWPNDLKIWRDDPNRYWAAFDDTVAEAGAYGVKLVPVVWWNTFAFADLAGEPFGHTFQTGSLARQYLFTYVEELVTRYAGDPTILFWELTNEMNLGADLDYGQRTDAGVCTGCGTPASRSGADDYSSDQAAQLLGQLAAAVKGWDPAHLVSPGYARPRNSAMHLRTRPEWAPGGPDWTQDTPAEMRSWVALMHPDPIDLVCVHQYDGNHDTEDFGIQGVYNPDLLAHWAAASDAIHKPLYLGEFGDDATTPAQDPSANFMRRLLLEALDLRVPVSSPWIWEFYQFSPTQADAMSLRPGVSAGMDQTIAFTDMVRGWMEAAPRNRSTALAVPNPGFEQDTNGNHLPDGWEVVWRNGTSAGWYARATTSAGDVFQGGSALQLYSGTGDPGSYVFALSDPIPARGGATVVLSYALRRALAAGARADVRLIQFDASGNDLGEPDKLYDGSAGYLVDAYKVTLAAAAATVRLRIAVGGAEGQVLDIDEVRLSQLD